jgi:hypothetical protein
LLIGQPTKLHRDRFVELVDHIEKILIQKCELLKSTVKAYLFGLGNELLGLLCESTLNLGQTFILMLL